jgi:hypothetical protein
MKILATLCIYCACCTMKLPDRPHAGFLDAVVHGGICPMSMQDRRAFPRDVMMVF